MLLLPFSDEPGTYKLFVVLEDDNIARCKEHDPAQVVIPPPGWEDKKLKLVIVGYASPDEQKQIVTWAQEGDNAALKKTLELLNRGFRFRPEAGDYDGPPMSIKGKGERQH